MQQDPALNGLALPVKIFGVNGIGHEGGNADNCNGRTLPWLQDVAGVDVWTLWNVTYRDVILLNADNEVVDVYNLTSNDLANPANYEALRNMLVQHANP